MASKRPRAATPSGATAASVRAKARSRVNAASTAEKGIGDPVLDTLSLFEASSFEDVEPWQALYRLSPEDPGCQAPLVKDRDDLSGAERRHDAVADAMGVSSPFNVVDLADRRGIWQSTCTLMKRLGEDPQKLCRELVQLPDADRTVVAPVGLKNLSATCYLNSLLQYLFFNIDFRQCLLNVSSNSDVVKALQYVFGCLAKEARREVDPCEFIQAAGVNVEEQEDATEFSTLLLDWLERELGQTDKEGGKFISKLFQGEVLQILNCLEHPGHTFERREPFLELRARLTPTSGTATVTVPSKIAKGGSKRCPEVPPLAHTVIGCHVPDDGAEAGGAATPKAKAASQTATSKKQPGSAKKKVAAPPPVVQLEHLLAETAFPDEMLEGSDKYHCPKCDRKVNARKGLRLASAPPYLNVTVERYHYDLQKGERQKLNNPVSIPQQLQLRITSSENASEANAAMETNKPQLVTYECIGFLEHVSDSAHSGHYRATLYQEEEDAAESLSASRIQGASKIDTEALEQESAQKRRRLTAPASKGLWWTLDDSTVTLVTWPKTDAVAALPEEEASEAVSCSPPQRIETASAYLVLYRRLDHIPGQLAKKEESMGKTTLPLELAATISSANDKLASECDKYRVSTRAIENFAKERRQRVESFVDALRKVATPQDHKGTGAAKDIPTSHSVVPSAWLNAYLRGEDQNIEELARRASEEAGAQTASVTYGPTLMRGEHRGEHVVDPLAVWCGEVKFVPTSALRVLEGDGISSLAFLKADCALKREPCEVVWRLGQLFVQEWLQIRKILQRGKVSVAEARALQNQGQGGSIVWMDARVQRLWQKTVPSTGGSMNSALSDALMAFMKEAQTVRYVQRSTMAESCDTDETNRTSASQLDEIRRDARRHHVSVQGGLLCSHDLVSRPRAGVLAYREDLQELASISRAKQQAYKKLWPRANVPRLCMGRKDGRLASFTETCTKCIAEGASSTRVGRTAQRFLVVRRRFPESGYIRKTGNVTLPDSDEPITGGVVRELVKDQLKLPVSKVIVPACPETGDEEKELQKNDALGDTVEKVLVEKDETVQPDKEAAAFHGSIFRGAVPMAVH